MLRMITLEAAMREDSPTPAIEEPKPTIIGYTLGGEPIERVTNDGPRQAAET